MLFELLGEPLSVGISHTPLARSVIRLTRRDVADVTGPRLRRNHSENQTEPGSYVNDQEKALRFYTEGLDLIRRPYIFTARFPWPLTSLPEKSPDGGLSSTARAETAILRPSAYQRAISNRSRPAVSIVHR